MVSGDGNFPPPDVEKFLYREPSLRNVSNSIICIKCWISNRALSGFTEEKVPSWTNFENSSRMYPPSKAEPHIKSDGTVRPAYQPSSNAKFLAHKRDKILARDRLMGFCKRDTVRSPAPSSPDAKLPTENLSFGGFLNMERNFCSLLAKVKSLGFNKFTLSYMRFSIRFS